jgi:glucan phosphoethanolaminetransferase (alkaline phosphatase superfamily)
MLVAFVATAAAKWHSLQLLDATPGPLALVSAIQLDALVFLGLTVVFALIESAQRRLWLLTWPCAGAVAALALANALYLGMAGEQGTWQRIRELLARSGDAQMILREMLEQRSVAGPAALLAVTIALPFIIRWLLARGGDAAAAFRRRALNRAAGAGALFAVVAVIGIATPSADSVAARSLHRNGLLTVLTTGIGSRSQPTAVEFTGWQPATAVDAAAIEALRGSPRPNLIVFILESTRFDYTQLGNPLSRAKTPHLLGLRRTSLFVPRMRAVVPHTTKSLFTVFCGRFPTLQPDWFEMADLGELQCLPDVLTAAGYRTAFYQSAQGSFEARPRLVDRFGFEEFMAGEDMTSPRVGYLSFADAGLIEPTLEFLKQQSASERPFLLTLLTSAAHHPYRLSDELVRRARGAGAATRTAQDRYVQLVQEQDRILGVVMRALSDNGLSENTIVLVLGDHGQGFGRHGVKGHDSVYFEEGLRVPFVVSGPGVRENVVGRNATLLDVMPTLLSLLGVPVVEDVLVGNDLLAAGSPSADPLHVFSCYHGSRCNGFVVGSKKVVRDPASGEIWHFDLVQDPEERNALPLTPELTESVARLDAVVRAHTTSAVPMLYQGVDRYRAWSCRAGTWTCSHVDAERAAPAP